MCENSKAQASGHRVVPGSSVTGCNRPSYELGSYPIGRTCPAMDFFHPARPFPCELISRRQLADAASCTIRRRPYGGIAPRWALLRGVSTRGKSPRNSACEVIMGSTMSSYLDRKRPLPLSKSLPRAAYRTAVRSFLLYHFLKKMKIPTGNPWA